MKQLLAVCGDYFIVGLQDRAFITCLKDNVDTLICELKPTAAAAAAAGESEGNNPKSNSSNDDEQNKKNREIQAVSITASPAQNNNEGTNLLLTCGVSRMDKSLEIYTVDLTATDKTVVESTLCHSTNKRVVTLCFGTIHGGNANNNNNNTVIIAGDLAGDVYAYSLHKQQQHKLLLGHTASMITSICMLTSSSPQNQQILSSDRDEKIRISQFPNSYIIDGFLLGHTAYVSSMDTAIVNVNVPATSSSKVLRLVASCGGDETMRLWNGNTYQQLLEMKLNNDNDDIDGADGQADTAAATTTTTATTTTEQQNVNEAEEEDDNNSSGNNKATASGPIPTNITISSNGSKVAIIFDQSKRLDLYQITIEERNDDNESDGDDVFIVKASLLQRLDCPCQPLSVKFQNNDRILVLLRDPEYCVAYNIHDEEGLKLQSMGSICQVVSNDGDKIIMPDTILEKDTKGQPKLKKLTETRVVDADAPWNRVERVDIAKKREKRAKKRRKEKK